MVATVVSAPLTAAMPELQVTAAVPRSNSATRASSTELVGLLIRL